MIRALLAAAVIVVVVSGAASCTTVRAEVRSGAEVKRRPPRVIDPQSINIDAVRFAGDEQYAWFDGATGHSLSFDEVLARMKQSRVIIVGEQHDQPTHHELERRVVASVAQAQPKVVVGLEMLTWNLQPGLDKYNAGTIDADAMAKEVDWSKSWGFPFEMYKPIFVDGHAQGARFIALNAPRELVRAVRKKGVAGLSADELRALPNLNLGDTAHRDWFKGIFSGGGHPANDSDIDSFYTAQVVWDESMAQTAARALDEGAPQVVVIAGIGHVARGRGIPERVERRAPGVHVLSIVPLTGADSENAAEKLHTAIVDGEADVIVVPRFEDEISL